MKNLNTDITNIFLMLLSVAFALALPFELFLISYAVLGPLHYATEISWLQQKEYFIRGKKDWLALTMISVLVTTTMIVLSYWPHFKDSQLISDFLVNNNLDKQQFEDEISLWPSCLIFFAFASAFILTFIKDWFWRINSFALALFLILLFKGTPNYTIIFGVLLVTIIHVWLFTGIFILSGAVKSKNLSNYISFIVFILCSLSFIFISRSGYIIGEKASEIVMNDGLTLNQTMLKILNIPFGKQDLISAGAALRIQAFIAFAYTYHYLNWFSKVEIIKWHKVSKNSLILSAIIWVISLSLYAYDYRLGASLLLFLSVLHVFLEFPLNFHSIAIVTGKK
ncbi:MAG: hypothetical protein EBS06_07720 [Proteobacteria bacterium]|nr:hypothetical protein [Pseudomonadota bacterium]